MEEVRIDVRIPEQANPEEGRRCMDLCFRINHTHPLSEEFSKLVSELFCGNIGEGSQVLSPMTVVRGHRVISVNRYSSRKRLGLEPVLLSFPV
jgi:hypothetical protein